MPTKGFFTQGAAILLADAVDLAALQRVLHKRDIARLTEGAPDASWMGGYPSALVAMRPEANGHVLVSVAGGRAVALRCVGDGMAWATDVSGQPGAGHLVRVVRR